MCFAMYITQNGGTNNGWTTTELLFMGNLTQIWCTIGMFHFVWGILYVACYHAIPSTKPVVNDLLQGRFFNWLLLGHVNFPLLLSEGPGLRNSAFFYPVIDFHLSQCLPLLQSIQSCQLGWLLEDELWPSSFIIMVHSLAVCGPVDSVAFVLFISVFSISLSTVTGVWLIGNFLPVSKLLVLSFC
jgi:hypothetical protein